MCKLALTRISAHITHHPGMANLMAETTRTVRQCLFSRRKKIIAKLVFAFEMAYIGYRYVDKEKGSLAIMAVASEELSGRNIGTEKRTKKHGS